MVVEVVVSKKGSIIIPKTLRKALRVKDGDQFLIVSRDDSIILKKLFVKAEMPSLEEIFKPLWLKAKNRGVKRSDIAKEIELKRCR